MDGQTPFSSSTVTQGPIQTQAAAVADVFHGDKRAGGSTVLQSGEPVLPLLEEVLPFMWWSSGWVL